MEKIFMTARQLRDLPNYSCSLPTGTTPGKQWRRADIYYHQEIFDGWKLGEYGDPYPEGHEHFGQIPIFWHQIVVIDAPRIWPRHVLVPPRKIPDRRGATVNA